MRTTVTLDDDVVEMAKRYATARSMSLGKALSELARRGAEAPTKTRRVNGLTVFDLPKGTPKTTTEHIERLQDAL
jgi:hypothetical protein